MDNIKNPARFFIFRLFLNNRFLLAVCKVRQDRPASMQNLLRASQYLEALLLDRDRALDQFRGQTALRPLQLFAKNHLPLLLSYVVGVLGCPFLYLQGLDNFKYLYILCGFILIASMSMAFLVDRLVENSGLPEIEHLDRPHRKNIALFSHLPLAGAGFFYIIHPVLGLLIQLLALYYSSYSALESVSLVFRISRARVLIHLANALILVMLPVLGLALIMALLRTYQILG